jgi:hypothetical protein
MPSRACSLPPRRGGTSEEIGPPPVTMLQSMALTGAVSLRAGEAPSVICTDVLSTKNTLFSQGNLTAILISNSSGTVTTSAAAATPSAH